MPYDLENFDKEFHGDHKKLNKQMKEAGIPIRWDENIKYKKKRWL